MLEFTGGCDCEAVELKVEGEPTFVQRCHCNKCREVASHSQAEQDKVGYSTTAAYLTKLLSVTKGKDQLEEIERNSALLYRCALCKQLLFGWAKDESQRQGLGLNLNSLNLSNPPPEAFVPSRDVYYLFRKVDMNDDLPKYEDMPKELGGSDKLVEQKRKPTNT